jgi:hypothetical protein
MQHENLYKIIEPHNPLGIKYFTFLFHQIPCTKIFKCQIEIEKLKTVLTNHYPEKSLYFIENGRFDKHQNYIGHFERTPLIAVLKDGLIIEHDLQDTTLYYDNRITTAELEALRAAILDASKKELENKKFFMIKKSHFDDFELVDFTIKNIVVKVSEYYNDDLAPIHVNLRSFLDDTDANGVVLFHGNPGTGKTSYIRHLIASCQCRFIYIPNNLFPHLSDPEFIAFISRFQESAIILEDCEELLRSRIQQASDNGIANLLNLGDGLLGDALKMKIICTFNCELSKIDEAMMRKGRLAYRYEFGPLTVEKSNQLFALQGLEVHTDEPMTLAEIFNFEQDNLGDNPMRKSIGF